MSTQTQSVASMACKLKISLARETLERGEATLFCARLGACVHAGSGDGPVVPRATTITLTRVPSRKAAWGGLACLRPLPLLSTASWWLRGPSRCLLCASEALPPSGPLAWLGAREPHSSQKPRPGGILSSTWHQACGAPHQDCISAGMKRVPSVRILRSSGVWEGRVETPPGTGQRGPWSQRQPGVSGVLGVWETGRMGLTPALAPRGTQAFSHRLEVAWGSRALLLLGQSKRDGAPSGVLTVCLHFVRCASRSGRLPVPLCPGLRLNSCPVRGTWGCQWSHQVLIQGVEDKGDRRCQLGTNAVKEA